MMAFDTGDGGALGERTREIPQLALLLTDGSAQLPTAGSTAEAERLRQERENPPAPRKRIITHWEGNTVPRAPVRESIVLLHICTD